MNTFNIISYRSGIIRGKIKEESYDAAFIACLEKNINVHDDYFLETVEETKYWDSRTGRTIYLNPDEE